MILRIVEMEVCGSQLLHLAINNGARKTVHVVPLSAGPVFEPRRDPVYFDRGQLDPVFGKASWPNDADLAPEAMLEFAEVEVSCAALSCSFPETV